MSNNDLYAYVGRAACGCIRASRLDEADRATGKFVQAMIGSGLTIERVPLAQAQFTKCPACEPTQPQQTSMLTRPVILDAEPCSCCTSRRALDYLPLTSSHQMECKQCGRIAHGATIDELLVNWKAVQHAG